MDSETSEPQLLNHHTTEFSSLANAYLGLRSSSSESTSSSGVSENIKFSKCLESPPSVDSTVTTTPKKVSRRVDHRYIGNRDCIPGQ